MNLTNHISSLNQYRLERQRTIENFHIVLVSFWQNQVLYNILYQMCIFKHIKIITGVKFLGTGIYSVFP